MTSEVVSVSEPGELEIVWRGPNYCLCLNEPIPKRVQIFNSTFVRFCCACRLGSIKDIGQEDEDQVGINPNWPKGQVIDIEVTDSSDIIALVRRYNNYPELVGVSIVNQQSGES